MPVKVECQYLKDENCSTIRDNDEVKEARKLSCNNDNESACCYLCSTQDDCEISCDFLGKKPTSNKVKAKKNSVQKCPSCGSKMLHTEVKLRIGGWSGLMQLVPFGGLGEIGEELLSVTLYVCTDCGKLEFIAPEKTKQMIISRC